ncbi:MAG: hypothetical protein J8272_00680, partial ['Prunus persica' phytoplasma PP2]|nr:hypothetical protein ['Prunus persica' phytoplasma PP2]
ILSKLQQEQLQYLAFTQIYTHIQSLMKTDGEKKRWRERERERERVIREGVKELKKEREFQVTMVNWEFISL